MYSSLPLSSLALFLFPMELTEYIVKMQCTDCALKMIQNLNVQQWIRYTLNKPHTGATVEVE